MLYLMAILSGFPWAIFRALYFSADPTWGDLFPHVFVCYIANSYVLKIYLWEPSKAWNKDGPSRNNFCFCQLSQDIANQGLTCVIS